MKNKNQLGIFDPESFTTKIAIIGVWWVGSVSSYYITQMWVKDVTIVDMDEVEIHNTSSQFYKQDDIGKSKVVALWENLLAFNWISVNTIHSPFSPEMVKWMDIVIAAVDNMDIRKDIIDACRENWVPNVVEARMSWEEFAIYTFDPLLDYDKYMDYRYPQSEVEPELCTMKSISYNTWVIGSLIAKIVRNIIVWDNIPFLVQASLKDFKFSVAI